MPTEPLAVVALVMTGIGVAMMIVTFWVALGKVLFEALTAKPKVPATAGVPLRTPVVALRVSAVGAEPEIMAQLIGAVPLAVKV